MTTATRAKTLPAKPPGRIALAVRPRLARAASVVRPYVISFTGTGVLAVILALAAPSLLWLAPLAAGAVLGIAADRIREHLGWHRKGGKAALRKRRRYQGPAPLSELARNLPAGQGVPIGTVRRQSW